MGIPKPLVQTNQLFIVMTVLLSMFLSFWILLIPFFIGVITLLTKKNPIMLIGKKFLKKPSKKYILEDPAQQLFNQWIATICLGLSFLFFFLESVVLGYVFSIMVLLAAGIALLGFCIGCTIRYRYLMWKHKRFNV
ncbi:hypothetical protein JCM9140_475 [Halalkalibacter wakoensis JCM 9140]|uniref:DUF4395 domain-containing protein n=1 Tax=Halalkalibacter wakoensis JCM 9140 TaxID=1236970 RepID=W4PZK9_9BACI|nr:DUF4395 family protein [Halalkalibacter wakoensis]GAE24539.1 hypothetical protein JCM9140_475 [Halalkalibacter wakoensis JCM 9140]